MAELSPELASRIQQLETSYAANPGRFFVALAGAWRDAGEISRAEEILRENLKRHHGLSAHVLLGRCLADRGAHQEAANEFHYVLSIDAQNLIALRTLAEMAQANGRADEARRWYGELLSVDPVNADARAALAALDRPGADAATVDEPVQVGTSWGGAGEGLPVAGGADAGFADERGEFGMVDLAPPSDATDAPAGLDAWGEIAIDDGGPAAAPSPSTADDGFDAFGFGSLDLDTSSPGAAPSGLDAHSGDEDDSGGWLDVDARQDVGESAAADASSYDDALPNAPLAGAGLPLLEMGDDSAAHDHGADHHDDVDAEVVTETMAELYASQGLLDRAAETYRTLIGQRGPEPGLVRRLAEIEAQAGGAAQPAGPSAFGAGDEEEAAPDWLAGVDAFAAGGTPSALPDTGLDASLGALDFGAADEPASAAAGMPSFDTPATAPEAASADPFADSFADGFGGGDEPARPEPAMASADVYDDRGAWEPPTVTPTESAGFDLIVVADDGGELHIPASAEEVADLSADWAVAAAPLDEGGDEDDLPLAAAAPAGATMAGYFQSLLSWTPGRAAAETPSYEAPVDDSGTLDFAPAAADDLDARAGAGSAASDAGVGGLGFGAGDGLNFAQIGTDAAIEAPARANDEPWAFPGDVPVAGPPVAEPGPEPLAADLEPLDLDDPWAAPATPRSTVDLEAFELSDELAGGTRPAGSKPAAPEPAQADDEGLLPWELPAEPSEPAAAGPAGGFSFEDFFAGSAPAAPATAPAPGPAPAPEPPPASFPALDPEPYTPPPSALAPPAPPPAAPSAPAAAAAAGAGAGAQEEDDEDLESFQAWLQSLKR